MTKKENQSKNNENIIYVGHKPPMSYVLAVITEFNSRNSEEVLIKARGKSISTAVDTAEIVRNRFVKDLKIKKITTETESVTNDEGKTFNVSSISICLTKK
jgi:archaea-specific DNA-binding protein